MTGRMIRDDEKWLLAFQGISVPKAEEKEDKNARFVHLLMRLATSERVFEPDILNNLKLFIRREYIKIDSLSIETSWAGLGEKILECEREQEQEQKEPTQVSESLSPDQPEAAAVADVAINAPTEEIVTEPIVLPDVAIPPIELSNEAHRNIIHSMVDLGAKSKVTGQTQRKIRQNSRTPFKIELERSSLKRCFVDLKNLGLIETEKRGSKSKTWLTATGIDWAESHPISQN